MIVENKRQSERTAKDTQSRRLRGSLWSGRTLLGTTTKDRGRDCSASIGRTPTCTEARQCLTKSANGSMVWLSPSGCEPQAHTESLVTLSTKAQRDNPSGDQPLRGWRKQEGPGSCLHKDAASPRRPYSALSGPLPGTQPPPPTMQAAARLGYPRRFSETVHHTLPQIPTMAGPAAARLWCPRSLAKTVHHTLPQIHAMAGPRYTARTSRRRPVGRPKARWQHASPPVVASRVMPPFGCSTWSTQILPRPPTPRARISHNRRHAKKNAVRQVGCSNGIASLPARRAATAPAAGCPVTCPELDRLLSPTPTPTPGPSPRSDSEIRLRDPTPRSERMRGRRGGLLQRSPVLTSVKGTLASLGASRP